MRSLVLIHFQRTAAFLYPWYTLKKGSLLFQSSFLPLVRITFFKAPDFRHSKWMHFWNTSPFFQNRSAQIIPTWLALKGTFSWVQRSSDQVIKEVKYYTSKVTGCECLWLHVKQKVYWAWMLQMKDSFHSEVVWEQIKQVGSFSEHNYIFFLCYIQSGQVRYWNFTGTISKSLFLKGLFRNNYSMFQ